jgi:hypothetical protein
MTNEQLIQLFFGSSVLAAVLSFWATKIVQDRRDERAARAAKYALQAELDNAAASAGEYLDPNVPKAPVWRLSTALYERAMPTLLGLGWITNEAAQSLILFYNSVDSFNRSLDQVAEHLSNQSEFLAKEEMMRAMLKAIQLTSSRRLEVLRARLDVWSGFGAEVDARLGPQQGHTHYDRARGALSFL